MFTLQDNYTNPIEPTEAMTFSQYGIVNFKVQFWNGTAWDAVTGGVVDGNNKVWRKFSFSNITTDKIRVRVTSGLASHSRITEIEAYQPNTAYDAAGNVTYDGVHTYQYDAENRQVSVDNGATATYKYDHQNRRVSKTVGSISTHYVWHGSQVIAEHDPATPLPPWWEPPYQVQSARVDYVYAGARMVYSTQRTSSTGGWTVRYYLSDRLSTRLVLDTSGNVLGRQAHLPFGEDFAESGTQEKHHFAGYDRDAESSVDYAINRGYSPAAGRFQSADPYAAKGFIVDPQSSNRYSYSGNDPVNRFDPVGLDWTGVTVAISNAMMGSITLHGWGAYPGSGGSIGTNGGPGSPADQFSVVDDSGSELNSEPGIDTRSILDLLRKFAKALSRALKALNKDECRGLFDTSKFDPRNLLVAFSNGDLGTIPGIAPGTIGSISAEPLTDDNGNPVPNQAAETKGILGATNSGRTSTWLGVGIYINSDPNAPWSRGFQDRLTSDADARRAVTLIHVLGHAAVWLFGANASKLGDDQNDARKSAENSKLVYDKCFK